MQNRFDSPKVNAAWNRLAVALALVIGLGALPIQAAQDPQDSPPASAPESEEKSPPQEAPMSPWTRSTSTMCPRTPRSKLPYLPQPGLRRPAAGIHGVSKLVPCPPRQWRSFSRTWR